MRVLCFNCFSAPTNFDDKVDLKISSFLRSVNGRDIYSCVLKPLKPSLKRIIMFKRRLLTIGRLSGTLPPVPFESSSS